MERNSKSENFNFDKSNNDVNALGIKEQYERYRIYWKWFLTGLAVSFLFCFLYLRYTPKTFEVNSSVIIDDKESGGLTTQVSAFEDLDLLGSSKASVDNEIVVLKSRSLIQNVIRNLRLNVSYFSKGNLRDVELYGIDSPFEISFVNNDSTLNELDTNFIISSLSETRYILKNIDDELIQEGKYDDVIVTDMGNLIVSKENWGIENNYDNVIVQIKPVEQVVEIYRDKINIVKESKESSILILLLEDRSWFKARDILNNLIDQYNYDVKEYKTSIIRSTDKFVNDRISEIARNLDSIDRNVETFKISNRLTDIGTESNIDLDSKSQLQSSIAELNSQIQLVVFIQEHIKNNKTSMIPANLGLDDASTRENALNYNRILLQKNRIENNSSKLNPAVLTLEDQLETLRSSINQSLKNLKSSLEFSLKEAQNQQNLLNSKRRIAPKQEREFQEIVRKQQIVESLYLYMLQKREENAISMGIPVPNLKIVDPAGGSRKPVSPQLLTVLLVGVIFGLGIPFLMISIVFIFDNKINSFEDIESVIQAPILGDIPEVKEKGYVVVGKNDNSSIAESFRLIRTNINFMLSGKGSKGKVIFVTSTIGSEGKTFISMNLAATLSLSDKRVLLIEADVRKPKMKKYLKIESRLGLTNILVEKDMAFEMVINRIQQFGVDLITSGEIPPNPSELLSNNRFKELLEFGRQNYDYIIVDTAPVNMVTDTLLIANFSDLLIYVIRAKYMDKRMLKIPQSLFDSGRLKNMTILLNHSDPKNKGYGYGYGYGYGHNGEKSISSSFYKYFSRIFN